MGIADYFRPVQTWPPPKVREFLKSNDPDRYNLVDVRQPEEYEKAHLPGARLIPLGDLPERLAELDPHKPTIVY
jgi:rhodanese-related sulfurtransferase